MRMRMRPGAQSGVAAVEAGLVTTFLMPMLVGVLFYGQYFWQAQKVDAYAPRVAQGQVTGYLTCAELVDAVTRTVAANANALARSATVDASDVTARVVQVLPDVGVTVAVSVRVPVVSSMTSLLPNNGAVVTEALLRLDDVSVTTTC